MISWRTFKQFPKLIFAAGIFTVSTLLFWWWWHTKAPKQPTTQPVASSNQVEQPALKTEPPPAVLLDPSKGHYLLVGKDLYKVDEGKPIAKNWFQGEIPQKLFLDAKRGKLIARYARGLMSFGLDGRQQKTLGTRYGMAFDENFKFATYAQEKDIWKAEINLDSFELVNPQRVTSSGIFYEQFFIDNILLATDKAILVRNMNQVLRVSMVTGEVTSFNVPLSDINDKRSPDGAMFAGWVTGQLPGAQPKRTTSGRAQSFATYAVERDELQTFAVESRYPAREFRWVNNNTCAFITGEGNLWLFDRDKQSVTKAMELPQARQLVRPSPTGRYVFCMTRDAVTVIDLEKLKSEALINPCKHYEWAGDDTLIGSRDVPDTAFRGTWLKKIGADETRVSNEPYLVGYDGKGLVMRLKEAGGAVFQTSGGTFKTASLGQGASVIKVWSEPRDNIVEILVPHSNAAKPRAVPPK